MGEIAPAFSALADQTDTENQARASRIISLSTAKEVLGLYDDKSQDTRLRSRVIPAALAVVEDIIVGPATPLDRTDYYSSFEDSMALTERASSLTAVGYLDEAGDEQTVDAADYCLDATRSPAAVRFLGDGAPSPSLYEYAQNAVFVTYTVQPFKGSPAGSFAVAEALKKILADLYRGGEVGEQTKLTAERILQPYVRDLGI